MGIGRRPALRRAIFAILAATGVLLLAAAAAQPQQRAAVSVELTGTIDPATAGWVREALADAAEQDRPLVIVRLDTPGGLDSSMRAIVRAILDAPLPVVVYVAPDGARAASAGLFITMAADVAAMAPQTNIGSATPISLGGGEPDEVLGRKIRNDAAAYVRALAEAHDRNADLAERMVREAVNVPAPTALRRDLVEIVAPSERALLAELDGLEVPGPKRQTLDTDNLRIERRDMPLQYEIQQLLVNPTVAYLLLIGGLLGIVFEVLSPGLGGPGVLGAVALVLGLYGSAQLPVTAAGIVLLVLAIGLFVAETQVPSFGVLGIAGIAALVAGGLLLYDTDSDVFRVSVPIAAATGVALGSFTLFAASKALAARRRPAHGGAEDLIGAHGTVRVALDPVGQVYVDGALWRARADEPLARGERVRVEAVDGLTLTVAPDPKESP
ncbi:MAG TPA: nodulation protein NfeD [Solirubrobacteraceae bacterium]|nr:nodulation protein NfeD [Solirubrobacteraceae bacterium]